MALWVCLFDDDEEMLAVRSARRAEHHAYLEAHRDQIVLAGALLPQEGKPPTGAAWVLRVDSRAAADALIAQDPYFASGHRRYGLMEWKLAREPDQASLLSALLPQGAKPA
jgi:uncharacterized protein YciI